MTRDQLEQIIGRITYKPGWRMLLRSLPDLGPGGTEERHYLRVEWDAPDAAGIVTARAITIRNQIRMEPEHFADEDRVLAFVRRFIRICETHESDEWLKLDGKAPFDPHRGEENDAS